MALMLAARRLGGVRARAAALATGALRAKHTLPDLPYDYNALEPVGWGVARGCQCWMCSDARGLSLCRSSRRRL